MDCDKTEFNGTVSNQPVNLKYESKGDVFKGLLLGFFIGLAIIVPGISGAAVAILFGLYEKLLYAIGNLFKNFKKCIVFLIPMIIGGVLGVAVGFFGVKELLAIAPFSVVAAFAGFMVGALPVITDKIKYCPRKGGNLLLFALGIIITVGASVVSVFASDYSRSLDNLQIYHYLLFLLLGYAIAVTQVVPGLSATALLMMLGLFSPLMNSVTFSLLKNVPLLMVFACLLVGFVIGIFTFSSVVSTLLSKRAEQAYYFISGLSIGAIATMLFNPEIYEVYLSWSIGGVDWLELIIGLILFVLGAFASFRLVDFERKKNKE